MDNTVKTGVDDLLDLLRYSPKMPLAEAAKKLKVPIDVIQAWVDFLVEEHVVGIEYKFTTPYIYMNKPIARAEEEEEPKNFTIDYFKRQFWDKAKGKNIPDTQIELLWKNHLLQELELKKKYFFFEAQQRKIKDIDAVWKEFHSNILSS